MRFLIHRPLPSTTCKNMEKLGLMLGNFHLISHSKSIYLCSLYPLGLVRWSLGQCRALQGAHKSLQHLSLPSRPCTRALSSPSLRQAPPTGLSPTARHPLQGEEPRQFLTADKETIVCVHPSLPVDFSTTKVSLGLGWALSIFSVQYCVYGKCMVCISHRLQCETLHFPMHKFPIYAHVMFRYTVEKKQRREWCGRKEGGS